MRSPARKTRFVVAIVNGDRTDTCASHADDCGGEACPMGECSCPDDEAVDRVVDMANPDAGDRIDYGFVYATDAGAARLMAPARTMRIEKDWWS